MKCVSALALAALGIAIAAPFCTTSASGAELAAMHERASATAPVAFDVYVPLQHRDQLDALLADQQNAQSPSYHQWLTPAEFHARFGASSAQIEAIKNELSAYGLSVTTNAHGLHATGSAHAVEQAFSTELHVAVFKSGAQRLAHQGPLTLPASMTAAHATVVGLSGMVRMHTHSMRAAAPLNRESPIGGYWFTDLKQAYKFPSYGTYNGAGVTIGILMTGGYNPKDMDMYFSHEKLATPSIREVKIAGGAPYDPNNSFETHLDLQQSGGMAPKANLVLYNLPDLYDHNIIDGLTTVVEDDEVDVLSMSFGGAESFYLASYNGGQDYTGILAVYDDLFKQGNAQGITFVASSGDQGALPLPPLACLYPNATSSCGRFQRDVEMPASSPHVTGVGGSNLVTTYTAGDLNSYYVSENANEDRLAQDIFDGTPATNGVWGSGGGDSIYYAQPSYQAGLDTGSKYRSVPDVSLHMGGCPLGAVQPCGPDRSYDYVALGGQYYGVIGTSASAPDFAGLAALKIQKVGGRLGNENPELYALAAKQHAGGPQIYHTGIPGYNGAFATRSTYDRVLGNGTIIGKNFLLVPNGPGAATPQSPSNP